jgi:hypothetical protein
MGFWGKCSGDFDDSPDEILRVDIFQQVRIGARPDGGLFLPGGGIRGQHQHSWWVGQLGHLPQDFEAQPVASLNFDNDDIRSFRPDLAYSLIGIAGVADDLQARGPTQPIRQSQANGFVFIDDKDARSSHLADLLRETTSV